MMTAISADALPARAFGLHAESCVRIAAPAADVFVVVDNHARLAEHMSKPSWWMGGGSMRVSTDAGRGQELGSHIRLAGSAFGVRVELDEIVTEREPPFRKAWETIGIPRLIVIGSYRMGFEITPDGGSSILRVFVDYELPDRRLPFQGALARLYAYWCTERMAHDAADHFIKR